MRTAVADAVWILNDHYIKSQAEAIHFLQSVGL